MTRKIKMFKRIIIITDDGIESENTKKLFEILKSKYEKVNFVLNKEYIQSKSNTISLNPVKLIDNGEEDGKIILSGGYPADCMLFAIYKFKLFLKKEDTLFVFGINNHNHCGYMNYTGSTTCLLSLAKCFGFKAVSLLCDEMNLSENFLPLLFQYIVSYIKNHQGYYAFNINEEHLFFKKAKISTEAIDTFETLDTSRGKYILLSFNKHSEIPEPETDSFYQKFKKNYITRVF